MEIKLRGRVSELYASTDPKYPGTSVTMTDVVAGGVVKIKFSADASKKIKLDGLYDVAGSVTVQLAREAFGAVRLIGSDGTTVNEVKT